jgi:hypothetical protein
MWTPRLFHRLKLRASADLATIGLHLMPSGSEASSNQTPVGRETPADAVLSLSVFDPFFIGIDEFGHPVRLRMMFRNVLAAGEPGVESQAS